MALTGISLRDRIKTKVEAATGNTMPSGTLDIWQAIAEAIVDEIQANAAVSTVTTCPAGAGTGTGTVA